LDFACDVGRQNFDTDAEAADNIKQYLEIRLSGIRNVEVQFDDGVATICGDCDNLAVKESAIPIAGNIKPIAGNIKGVELSKRCENDLRDLLAGGDDGFGVDDLLGLAKRFF
jgi:hypothetical protein